MSFWSWRTLQITCSLVGGTYCLAKACRLYLWRLWLLKQSQRIESKQQLAQIKRKTRVMLHGRVHLTSGSAIKPLHSKWVGKACVFQRTEQRLYISNTRGWLNGYGRGLVKGQTHYSVSSLHFQ